MFSKSSTFQIPPRFGATVPKADFEQPAKNSLGSTLQNTVSVVDEDSKVFIELNNIAEEIEKCRSLAY